jgi:RNA polymerase sigma-32 factor
MQPVANIDRYVAEINRYPILSRSEEFKLAKRHHQQGDELAGRRLVVANLRFVVKVAHEYRGYGMPLPDLIQEGNVGLMHAVSKFEPDRGYRLISYAVWWIRAYIQNFIMRSWSLIKLGTTQAQRKLFFKLRSERDKVEHARGTQGASPDELAKRLEVRPAEIIDMDQRLAFRDFSLDAPVSDDSRQTHLDQVLAGEIDQEYACLLEERRALVYRHVGKARATMNEKERHIIEHRLMADEPQTLQEIGAHFGISRERARQIEGNVLKKLRLALRGTGLDEAA